MRKIAALILASALITGAFAELSVKASAAVQLTKKNPSVGAGNLDGAFARGETKFAGTQESGLTGLVHLRFQTDLAGDFAVKARQIYLQLPVSILTIKGGRWYEIYTPGKYFGRYLFGVGSIKDADGNTIGAGSGSMKTNYNVVDGLRLSLPIIKAAKTDLHVAMLPQDPKLESIYTMVRISSNPIEMLTLGVGGNIHVLADDKKDADHRLIANTTISPVENLNFFFEYGNVNLQKAKDNNWLLWGLDIPTGKILDLLRVEMEYKKDRIDTEKADLGWVVILAKKAAGVKFDLNVGADPKSLGSKDAGDVGAILRISAGF